MLFYDYISLHFQLISISIMYGWIDIYDIAKVIKRRKNKFEFSCFIFKEIKSYKRSKDCYMNYWTKCSFLYPKSGVRIHFIYGDTFVWVISFFYICPMGIMNYNRCRHLVPYNFFSLKFWFPLQKCEGVDNCQDSLFIRNIFPFVKNKMHIQWKTPW